MADAELGATAIVVGRYAAIAIYCYAVVVHEGARWLPGQCVMGCGVEVLARPGRLV